MISEVKDMESQVFQELRKCFILNSVLTIFKKEILFFFRLIATTFSLLELALIDSMST